MIKISGVFMIASEKYPRDFIEQLILGRTEFNKILQLIMFNRPCLYGRHKENDLCPMKEISDICFFFMQLFENLANLSFSPTISALKDAQGNREKVTRTNTRIKFEI